MSWIVKCKRCGTYTVELQREVVACSKPIKKSPRGDTKPCGQPLQTLAKTRGHEA